MMTSYEFWQETHIDEYLKKLHINAYQKDTLTGVVLRPPFFLTLQMKKEHNLVNP